MSYREVAEEQQTQGVDEEVFYTLDVTKWGDGPSNASIVVKDESDEYRDVTSEVSTGSATISSNVITLPVIKSLLEDHMYRVEILFTLGGNKLEAFLPILGEL